MLGVGFLLHCWLVPTQGPIFHSRQFTHGAIAMACLVISGFALFSYVGVGSSSGTQSLAASSLPMEPSPQPSALFFETGSHVAQARLELNM